MEHRRGPRREVLGRKESVEIKLGSPIISFDRPGHKHEYLINAERFPPSFKLGSEQDSFDRFFHQMAIQLSKELGPQWSVENRLGSRIEIIRRINLDELPPIDSSITGIARLDRVRELEEPLYRDDEKIIAAVKKVFGEQYSNPVFRTD